MSALRFTTPLIFLKMVRALNMIGNISGCSCDLLRRCIHGSSALVFLKQPASCVYLGLHSACVWMGGLPPSLQKLEVHRTRAGKLPHTHQKILQLWLLTTSPTIHASFIERGKLPRGHCPAGDKPQLKQVLLGTQFQYFCVSKAPGGPQAPW